MRFAFFVAVLATLLGAYGLNKDGYPLQFLEYPSSRQSFSKSELDFLSYVLETDGIVAITKIPQFEELRRDCFQTMAGCYEDGRLNKDQVLTVELADGTKRVTLAMRGDLNDVGCSGLREKMQSLRKIVDDVSLMFARALDASILNEDQQPLMIASNNIVRGQYPSFESIIKHGDHLDHLHVYTKPSKYFDGKSNSALESHVDQGFFVAIVPSMTFKDGNQVTVDDGFEVELPLSKGMTRVIIPHDSNSLVFMMGDGMNNFLTQGAIKRVRPTPHRLIMEETHMLRVWFGRMFFPPKDAFVSKQRTTFEKVRLTSVSNAAARNVGYGGCSNKADALLDLTDNACKEDEIYCWMACRSTAGLLCNIDQTIQCVNGDDGKIWTDQSSHCFSCTPQCYNDPSKGSNDKVENETIKNEFCNTALFPTNMYMDGFNGMDSNIPCLVFLFKSWILDTRLKFALGAFGSFIIGLSIEFFVFLRREIKLSRKSRRYIRFTAIPDGSQPKHQFVFLLILYSAQLIFAYLAMLLAMSFSSVIFSAVMLGLIVGHVIFNFEQPASKNEACCAVSEETSSGPDYSPLLERETPTNCCQTNNSDSTLT